MIPKTISLAFGEVVIAVVPQRASGPGWSNAPVWVYISTNDGRLREECIQPDERTPEMQSLYAVGDVMCAALAAAVPTKKAPIRKKGAFARAAGKKKMKLVMTSGGCLPEASIGQYRRAHGAPTVPVTVHVFDRTSRKCKVWRAPVSEKLGGEPVMRLIYGTTGTVFDEDGRCLSSAQVWITAR